MCSPHAETLLSSLIKRKDAVSAEKLFRFRESGHIDIIVPLPRGSISMPLSHQKKRRRFVTNPERMSLLTSSEKEEVLEITDAAGLMDLSEEGKREMEVLDTAMISICYVYHADVCDIEERHEADTGEKLVESVSFLPSNTPYSVRC